MLRVFRLLRMTKKFPELRQMVVSLAKTLSTLLWVGVGFTFCMFFFSVGILQGIAVYTQSAQTAEEISIAQMAKQEYGSLQDTMLQLFHILTGGDWLQAAE